MQIDINKEAANYTAKVSKLTKKFAVRLAKGVRLIETDMDNNNLAVEKLNSEQISNVYKLKEAKDLQNKLNTGE